MRHFKFLQSFFVFVVAGGLLVACSTVVPGIVDIDKSQPSVTLGVHYTEGFDTVDWPTALQKATTQCVEFGYKKADPLELARVSCIQGSCTAEQKYICRN